MRILINCSNIKVGGALQVATSLIQEWQDNKFQKYNFHIILSPELEIEISNIVLKSNFKLYKLKYRPGISFKGIKANKELVKLEEIINPSCVLSIFCPTYWKPKKLHIAGFGIGWTINPDSIAFNQLSFFSSITKRIQNYLKLKISKHDVSIFIGETEVVRERLNKFGSIPLERIHVVGNTFGSHFKAEINLEDFLLPDRGSIGEFRFITISANYSHKNLSILKEVIPILRSKKINAKFFITISQREFINVYKGFDDYIINLGPVSVHDCPALYYQCDALFLPTLLESFTASYPEAMIMKIPILTSDLDFARNICGDAAEYFNPLDPKNISEKIISLINNKNRYNELINLGLNRVKSFPFAKERATKFIDICELEEIMKYHETNHPGS